MVALRWVFISLSVLSIAASFIGSTVANGALADGNQDDYQRNQGGAEVAVVAGVAWAVLAVAVALGEGLTQRSDEARALARQLSYGTGPYYSYDTGPPPSGYGNGQPGAYDGMPSPEPAPRREYPPPAEP